MLDIQKMLYDANGKAKVAIFNLSFLDDAQRMFFVSLLLSRYIAWMRRGSGSDVLKAILYMDEIFGYFPPSKNPPSKEPMLLLLKQARAFGLGMILSTQNPVDLDYKGLSNIGMWFIGRLQTTQDIDRVINGLSSQIGTNMSKEEIAKLLQNLPKRTFLLKSIYEQSLQIFMTRWTMSYLKGPLSRDDIETLMQAKKGTQNVLKQPTNLEFAPEPLDGSIEQFYESNASMLTPTIGAKTSIYFYDKKREIEKTIDYDYSLMLHDEDTHLSLDSIVEASDDFSRFSTAIPPSTKFYKVPNFIKEDKGLKATKDALLDWLYQNSSLDLFVCKGLSIESSLEESKSDFMVRINDALRAKKDAQIEKLKDEFASKEEKLNGQLANLDVALQREKSQSTSSWLSVGASVLGAILGKGKTGAIGSVITQGGKLYQNSGEIDAVESRIEDAKAQIEQLHGELNDEITKLDLLFKLENYPIDITAIKPKKSDINIPLIALVWRRI